MGEKTSSPQVTMRSRVEPEPIEHIHTEPDGGKLRWWYLDPSVNFLNFFLFFFFFCAQNSSQTVQTKINAVLFVPLSLFQGNEHGPFADATMRSWVEDSYFKPDLKIRMAGQPFAMLCEYFPSMEDAFLWTPRMGPTQNQVFFSHL
jgi:hypothetical protein